MGGKHQKIVEYSEKIEKLIELGLEKRDIATTQIESLKSMIKELKKLGVESARAEKLLKKSQIKLESATEIKDYDEAIKYAEIASKLIIKVKSQYNQAKKLITSAKEKLSNLEKKEIIITQPHILVQRAEKAFKNNDFETSQELSKKSREQLKELESNFKELEVIKQLIDLKMAEAGKSNINIAKAEKIFDQIQSSKDKGEYRKAVLLSKKTMKIIKIQTQNYHKASELIENAFTKINDAKDIEADTTDSEELLTEATSKMEIGDYETVIKLASKCIEAAENEKNVHLKKYQNQASDMISNLQKDLEESEKFGANIKTSNAIFKQVKSALENKDFKATFNNIELCKNSIAEAMGHHQQAMDKIHSARGIINDTNKFGADTNKAKQIILKAEKALNINDYETVEDQVNISITETEKARELHRQLLGLKEQAEDIIKNAKSTVDELKGSGLVVTGPEQLLIKSETALSNSDFQLAQKYANMAVKEGKEIQTLYAQASENLKKAETSIANSKITIDTTGAEKLFEQSQTEMKADNYSGALKFATKTIENIEKIKTNKYPILTLKCPDIPTIKSGEWAKYQLEIINESKVHANEIKLQISEEIETRGFMTIKFLKAGERKTIDIGLRTQETGEVPVNIGISYTDPLTNEQLESQELFWVNAEPGGLAPKFEPDKIPREVGKEQEPPGGINVLSELEFFQGFVRLKVGIKNDQKTVITDTKLYLEYDNAAMKLGKIEPDLERRGNKITFGNIHPGEKRTVACYLDPLICTESYVDGTLIYKDIWGETKTSVMKRRKAEVVCPIFYTPENINTAMLKRLINEELMIHDSKIYEIPTGVDFKRAIEICKDTILGHDLKFVREFVESDIYDPEIESWYYGMTKVKKNKVVIKASSRKKTNTIELFVACKSKQVLTGFLAELAHNLNKKFQELGLIKQPIYPLTDASTYEEIMRTGTLLSSPYLEKATLSLSKRGDEYEVGFKTSEGQGEASEVFEFIKVSPASRQDLLTQINYLVTTSNIFYYLRGKVDEGGEKAVAAEAEKALKKVGIDGSKKFDKNAQTPSLDSLGKLLYGMFLPVSIQKHLVTIKEPLILKTNDNEIPWELLHDENEFICLKLPMGRKLRSRETSRVNSVTKREKIRILFIANARGDLKSAENEVDYIKSNLNTEIEVEILTGDNATNASILSTFRNGKYDIIHYAGHAEFNSTSPDESALLTANNGKIFAQEIKRLLGGRPFVFLNACSSGLEKICENGKNYSGSDTEGFASSFILGGALAFIGASWPTPDLSAGMLASMFYKHFLSGETVGESLRRARIDFRSKRPEDINWSAFTLYGDPTLRLTKERIIK